MHGSVTSSLKQTHFLAPQVSVASANPALSCAKKFPTFVRTIPPEHFQNAGRVAIVKFYQWKRVAVLWERLDTFQGLANDLVYRLKKAGVQIITFESFSKDSELQLENIQVHCQIHFSQSAHIYLLCKTSFIQNGGRFYIKWKLLLKCIFLLVK